MKEKLETMKETLDGMKVLSKREYLLSLAVCTLLGIVIGYICAPAKRGIRITCGNGNGNNYGGDCDEDYDCDCDCDEDCDCVGVCDCDK